MSNIFHKLGDFVEDWGDVILFVSSVIAAIGLVVASSLIGGKIGIALWAASVIPTLWVIHVLGDIIEMWFWQKALDARDAREAE